MWASAQFLRMLFRVAANWLQNLASISALWICDCVLWIVDFRGLMVTEYYTFSCHDVAAVARLNHLDSSTHHSYRP
jgi:hypothetical protein